MLRTILFFIFSAVLIFFQEVNAQEVDSDLANAKKVKALMNREMEDLSILKAGGFSVYYKNDSVAVNCDARVENGEMISDCNGYESIVKDINFLSRKKFKYSGWYQGDISYHLNFPKDIPKEKTAVKKGWILYPEIHSKRFHEKYTQDGQEGKYTFMHSEKISDKVMYSFKDETNMLHPSKWDRGYEREEAILGNYLSFYKNGKKKTKNTYEIMRYTHMNNNSVKDALECEVEVTVYGNYSKWYESGKQFYTVEYDETYMKNFIKNDSKNQNEILGEGKLKGKYTAWHENGMLMCEGKLKNGRQEGTWKYYDFNGILSEEMKYKNGKLTGDFYAYYDNGEKRRKVTYYNNWKTGLGFVYFEDGTVFKKTEYVKDQKFGLYQEYNRKGTLLTNGFFQKDKKTDKWERFYANGTIKLQEFYQENLLNGIRTEYYRNGAKLSQVPYQRNREKGAFVKWFKDGAKMITGKFHDGIKNGSWLSFFKSGTKKEMVNYAVIKNPKDSIVSVWYEDEKMKNEIHLRNGMWKKYYDNGQVKMQGNFTNGRLDGQVLYFDTSGVVVKKEIFVAGERKGDIQTYHPSGKIKMKGNYSDDVSLAVEAYFNSKGVQTIISGKGTITNQSKSLKEIVNYEFGAPHGEWKSWTQDGNLYEVGTYTRGEETGKYIQYSKSGKIKEEGSYLNGLEHGNWKSYRVNGDLIEEGEYNEGEKVGKWTYYYRSGKKKEVIEHHVDGDKVWSFWAESGMQKVKEGTGEYFDRDINGIAIKGLVVKGLKEGQWNLRNSSKDVEYIVTFKNGEKLN